jgi:hypothetical protein
LSPDFFRKKWPKRELNGLVAREMSEPKDVILPIWHNVSQKEVLNFSPPLADKKAVDSKRGLKVVCAELLRKLRPQESPLIVARDELIQFGLNPPVVTDEWWLDVIEASNRIPDSGAIPPENSMWGRWTFPLPDSEPDSTARGLKLAWTAMQMQWEKNADIFKITQITNPAKVHDFIHSQAGLREACHDIPAILACYAPQLTISGCSGEFEQDFDLLLSRSINKHKNYTSGSGITITGKPPLCDEYIALRHPTFGDYESSNIACHFVQGDLFGPHPRYYEHFEYLVWLLSSDSSWLPAKIHDFLIDGMRGWNVWHTSATKLTIKEPEYFLDSLYKARSFKTFKFNSREKKGLDEWIKISLNNLELTDNPFKIRDIFIQLGFIEAYFQERKRKK